MTKLLNQYTPYIVFLYIGLSMLALGYIAVSYESTTSTVFGFIQEKWHVEPATMAIFFVAGGLGLFFTILNNRTNQISRFVLTLPLSFYIISSFLWAVERELYQVAVIYSIILIYLFTENTDNV